MRTACLLALALTWGARLASAEPWSLADCGPKQAAAHAAFEEKVRDAKPGSLLYLPHPYPLTQAEVVADFAYQFQEIWRDTALPDVPPDEQRTLSAIADGRLTAELVRVENWGLTRCLPERRRLYFHLLRLFDRETGRELGRAALDDSGLFAQGTHFSGDIAEAQRQLERRKFPRLAEARAQIDAAFRLPVQGAQYVHATGTIRCDLLSPCVAFKSRGAAFLYGPILERESLYRLDESRPRLSFQRDLATPTKKAAVERTLGAKQRVVSLGGDAFTVVSRVEPSP
jgi:hypothetical protein